MAVVGAAIAAVEPGACLRAPLSRLRPTIDQASAWHVVAAGKAAGAMMRACLASIERRPASALCASPGHVDGLPAWIRQFAGGHPTPNDQSAAAGRAALDVAAAAGPDDLLVVLLSGGASALFALPVPGVPLVDKQATTDRLLRAGATIHALNSVRKHLSAVKGGRLAASTRARTVCLAISDVVGDDPSVIGSGPAVGDPTTYADALRSLDSHGGRAGFPASVVQTLQAGLRGELAETPKPASVELRRSEIHVIASQLDAVRGAQKEARARGYEVHLHEAPIVGEARNAAIAHAAALRLLCDTVASSFCVVSAGETTVRVAGQGLGGRNQEFALALVEPLARWPRAAVAVSVGTDGIDGPTSAAGAIIDSTSLERALESDLVPARYLADNDAYHFFRPLGDLVVMGPTGTNVGDVQVVVVANRRP